AQGADIRVEAVTAGGNIPALADACRRLKPRFAVVANEALLSEARAALVSLDVEVGAGPSALEEAGGRPAGRGRAAILGAAGAGGGAARRDGRHRQQGMPHLRRPAHVGGGRGEWIEAAAGGFRAQRNLPSSDPPSSY